MLAEWGIVPRGRRCHTEDTAVALFFLGRWRWVRCPPGSFPTESAGGSPREEARGFERSPGHYLCRPAVTRNRRTLAECACPIDPSITRGRNHSRRARYTPIAMHIFLDINQLLVSRQTWAIPREKTRGDRGGLDGEPLVRQHQPSGRRRDQRVLLGVGQGVATGSRATRCVDSTHPRPCQGPSGSAAEARERLIIGEKDVTTRGEQLLIFSCSY